MPNPIPTPNPTLQEPPRSENPLPLAGEGRVRVAHASTPTPATTREPPNPTPQPAVRLQNLQKRYGPTTAVDNIDLAVQPGEFLTLLGPSGCGKTTTLSLIAGFIEPDRGSIELAGRHVEALPPFRRDIGLVFQDYALFPHMDVAANVGFGLRMRRIPKAEAARRVAEALDLVQLSHLGARRPAALSGGQRQRVALARALVIRPAVLLLDEPLSNLDLKLREEMRLEISAVQRRTGVTTILVTHDQGEALAVSDRIAVMRAGRIEQIGRPGEIYEHPATRFVAEFIGTMNFFPGETLAPSHPNHPCPILTPHGTVACPLPTALPAGSPVTVAIRPERLRLNQEPGEGGLSINGTIEHFVYLGSKTELRVRAGDATLTLEQANDGLHTPFAKEQQVRVVENAPLICVPSRRSARSGQELIPEIFAQRRSRLYTNLELQSGTSHDRSFRSRSTDRRSYRPSF